MSRALAGVIAAAIMRERATIERALKQAGVASSDVDDVCQDVVVLALAAAQEERVAWERRPTLQKWLAVVAYRRGLEHVQRAARHELLSAHMEDVRLVPSAEERYLVREAIHVAARSTTPERWRALRAWANGVDVADIAKREGLTVPGVYSRIQAARGDIRAAMRRVTRGAFPLFGRVS